MKGKSFWNWSGLQEKLQSKKAAVILVLIAFAGIILILLSEWVHFGSSESKQTVQSDDIQAYENETGQRLETIIGRISGVGRVQVLVTAESGVENVYEQDSKSQTDSSRQQGGDGSVQTQASGTNEQNPTVVENSGGGQQALLRVQKQPEVLGVVVVCDGGGSADVQESVVNAVTVALGITSNQVSVNPMREK